MAISLTTSGVAYTQNFDGLATTGTTNDLPTALPGWQLSEAGLGARDNEQYAADNGGSNTGDTYSYGVAGNTDRALGSVQSGTLISTFGAFFTNNTGSTITSLAIQFTGEQWRLAVQNRADRLDFSYSTDAVEANGLTSGTWTDVNELDFTTPNTTATVGALIGNDVGNRTTVTFTLSNLNIASGSTFAIRWSDLNASGSDDGLAIDDFSITPTAGPDVTPPVIQTTALSVAENETAAGTIVATDASPSLTYAISGGADGVLFSIDATTGVLSFLSAPDFENPADADGDNVYDIAVSATDASNNVGVGNVQVTVTDVNENLPTLSIGDIPRVENLAGVTTFTFTVQLSAPAGPGGVTFDIATADGTATAASGDYVQKSLTAQTIPAGSTQYTFQVAWNDDTAVESDETFFVNVTNVTGANVADGQAIGTITNDDVPPVPSFVLINEVDPDQTGTDTGEFVELIGTPDATLNGYTLVFYNGSTDTVYASFDLDGYTLGSDGLFVVGNSAVAGVDLVFANNTLQNGADAVALYTGDIAVGASVTATNLVDALVYDNATASLAMPDDFGLIDVLTPGGSQLNENDRGNSFTYSFQRMPGDLDGRDSTAFKQFTATPGAANNVGSTPAAAGAATHSIHDVQGPGATSPLAGSTVTVDAIVVGDFQGGDADVRRSLNGFYIQEEDANADADPMTSEGIFAFGGFTDVNVGDRVRVTGTVSEFQGSTQITVTGVTIVAPAQPLPTAAVIYLPSASAILDSNSKYAPDLEQYEGMLVTIPTKLTITEQFNLDRFNEIKLSAGGRLEQFANEFDPSTPGYAAYLQELGKRTITYDDGLNLGNESINYLDGFDPNDNGRGPSTVLPGEAGYGTATAPRLGDTITNLTGILDWNWAGATASNNTWRVRSTTDGANTFVSENTRPTTSPDVGGTLKVASFNVLNYFTTLSGNAEIGLEVRGANDAAEFARQTAKLVNFITTLNADILGLTELENDFFDDNPADALPGGNAVKYLVDQLNAATAPGTYAYIDPGAQLTSGEFFGSDAIAVGFVYKTAKVSVAAGTTIEKLDDSDAAAQALLAQSTVGAIFNGVNTSRAALAVTFHETATGEDFTAVINHWKSKSGTGTGADADQLDGQGAWQNQRELAAQALRDWIATKPTGTTDDDVLFLGDFNAYLKEQSLAYLKNAGFKNIGEELITDPYSYVFDGMSGAIDHAFASASLFTQVTGAEEWHVNADEADALDYNLDFERDPSYFNSASIARESDHDPIVVGLQLGGPTMLVSSTPADNAIDVAIDAIFTLTFSGNVHAGAGNIIFRPSSGADITVDVGSPGVGFNNNVVTINPPGFFRPGIAYDVIIGAGVILDAGNASQEIALDQLDFVTSSAIPGGAYTTTFTLPDPGTFTLAQGDTRTHTAGNAVAVTGTGVNVVINGTLEDTATGQRTLNFGPNTTGSITIGDSGVVRALNEDAIRVQSVNGRVDLTNLGDIIVGESQAPVTTATPPNEAPEGFAVQYNAVVVGAAGPLDFLAGGLIQNGIAGNTTALIRSENGDAVRLGSHQTLVNYGTIDGNGLVNDSSANNVFVGGSTNEKYGTSRGVRINQDNATAIKVDNYGLIEGAQHAVDVGAVGASNLFVTNRASGQMVGKNGSGVGADTTGAAVTTITVENFGLIRGEAAPGFDRAGLVSSDGDGDGVDVDGGATIINHAGAIIEGVGQAGFDSNGRGNNGEGISIGGGLITNEGIIRGSAFGIVVNNDANPGNTRSGVGATSIDNKLGGEITGQNGYAIRFENKTNTVADNDIIDNAGTITGNGGIPSGTVIRQNGSPDGGVAGTLDGVTYTGADAGSARFIRGDGSAIQMGEGNDILTNRGTITGNTGRAINTEGGDDVMNFHVGHTVTGLINGGFGNDTINLFGTGVGLDVDDLGNVTNVETLNVQSGNWVLLDPQTYNSVVVSAGGALLVNFALTAGTVTVNGQLAGAGQVNGPVQFAAGSTLAVASFGIGDIDLSGPSTFSAGSTLSFQLAGSAAGTYDQINAFSTLDITGSTLDVSLINLFNPEDVAPASYTLINKSGAGSVVGTFAGLAEGATLSIGSGQFRISYVGGDGNDVVLTAINDAPVNTVPVGQTVDTAATLVFSTANANAISIADIDAGAAAIQVTLTAGNGTMTLAGTAGLAFTVGDGTADGTMTFTGTIADINTALNGLAFTPTAGFTGAAGITIVTNDLGNSGGGDQIDNDAVAITVTGAPPPGNTAPVAAADAVGAVTGGTTSTGNVLANDSDPQGTPLTVAQAALNGSPLAAVPPGGLVIVGAAGTLAIQQNGSYSYVARGDLAAGTSTPDVFNYVASDGALASNQVALSFAVQGTAGTAGGDTLIAAPGGSTLNGGAGNDLIAGGAGSDNLDGGADNDTVEGGGGNDTLAGGTGTDTASYVYAAAGVLVNLNLPGPQNTGGAGTDTLSGFENLAGSAFNDTLIGDAGNNTLAGGAGNDTIEGGAGNDTLVGGDGVDTAAYTFATSGVTVSLATAGGQNTGGAGIDALIGFENLVGSAHADVLTGDAGANTIVGGAGADIIRGAGGADVLVGGTGADFFTYAAGDSSLAAPDIITDFEIGLDKIDFRFLRQSAADSFSIAQSGGFTMVTLDLGGNGTADLRVLLSGAPALAAADILMSNPTAFAQGDAPLGDTGYLI